MAGKKPNGGGGGMFRLGTIVKALLALGILFAFFQIPSDPSVKGIAALTIDKSKIVAAWIKNVGEGLQQGKLTLGLDIEEPPVTKIDIKAPFLNPASPDFNAAPIVASAETIPTSNFNKDADYDRYLWKHWDNVTPCWTVREEVLYRDAVKDDKLTMLDSNKVRTNDKNAACYIVGGTWIDPYTKETFTNPEDLDIDHMVALGYASKAGGSTWDSARKESFANSLDYPYHLIAVSASANRSKSDKGPSEWKPANEDFHCQYAIAWTTVLANWELNTTSSDKSAIIDMLGKCKK